MKTTQRIYLARWDRGRFSRRRNTVLAWCDQQHRRNRRRPPLDHLAAWFRADTGVVADSAGGVSVWADSSGHGNDLLQASGVAQPLVSRADNAANWLTWSQQFDQAAWVRTNLNAFSATDTGAAGAGSFANTARVPDPEGGAGADFLQENALTGNHELRQGGVTTPPTADYWLSVYARPAGRQWLGLFLGDSGNAANAAGQYFNLATGTAGSTTATGSASVLASQIQPAGNGWFRCLVALRFTSGSGPGVDVTLRIATADGTPAYAGDNTSGVFLWGAQLAPTNAPADYVASAGNPQVPGRNGRRTVWFNGTSHYLRSGPIALAQPETVYVVLQQIVWVGGDKFMDGLTPDAGVLGQKFGAASPRLVMFAGGTALTTDDLPLGTWGVVTSVFNSGQSLFQVNAGVEVAGDAGSGNLGGLTLGASGAMLANGQFQAGELLVYAAAHDASVRRRVRNYLAARWGVSL